MARADDVLEVLVGFVDRVAGGARVLLVGHSAGAYLARAVAARRPDRVAGLALVCPLLPGLRYVPEHRPVVAAPDLGDEGFRDYFVVQTPAMLERYEQLVAPAAALVDLQAAERIGARWELTATGATPYAGPTLVVAGRRDATVGCAAAVDLLGQHPRASLAVLEHAGHALPHEQPALLAALLHEWLERAVGTPPGAPGAPPT